MVMFWYLYMIMIFAYLDVYIFYMIIILCHIIFSNVMVTNDISFRYMYLGLNDLNVGEIFKLLWWCPKYFNELLMNEIVYYD